MRSLGNQILDGTIVVMGGTGAKAFAQLLSLIILARLLDPYDFGAVSVGLIIIGLLLFVCQASFGHSLIQREHINSAHISSAFLVSALYGIAVAILLTITGPPIARFFGIEHLNAVFTTLAWLNVLTAISIINESLLIREFRFKVVMAVDFASYVCGYLLVAVPLAFKGFGIWALVLGHGVQLTTKALAHTLPSTRRIHSFDLNLGALRQLLHFSIGYSLVGLGNFLAQHGEQLVIGRWLGSAALGVYGRAHQLVLLPAHLIGGSLDKVLFSSFSRLQSEKDLIHRTLNDGLVILSLVAFPAAGVIFFVAPDLIYLLLGSGWAAVVEPLRILALSLFFRVASKICDSVIRAYGAVYIQAGCHWFYASLIILGAFIGKKWGISGIAAMTSLAVVLHFFVLLRVSAALSHTSWRAVLLGMLAGLTSGIVTGLGAHVLTTVLRALGFHPLLIIASASGLFLLTMILTVYYTPGQVISSQALNQLRTKILHSLRFTHKSGIPE